MEENSMFQEAVELLAIPIFPKSERRGGFSGAIRQHIDDWNAAKRKLSLEIRKFRRICGAIRARGSVPVGALKLGDGDTLIKHQPIGARRCVKF
jgi:hypothetical protein